MKRHVLTALPVLALAGVLTACSGAPADDASPAPVESTSPTTETVEKTKEPAEKIPDSLQACIASNETVNEADPEVSTEALFDQSAKEFCEDMRSDDPKIFDETWGLQETSATERAEVQGDAPINLDAALDVCIEMTEDGAGYFDNDMPAKESCLWQQAISLDDFAVMYDLSASGAEQQEAMERLQDVAEAIHNY